MANPEHSTESVTVYGLASSEDGRIRYVGQTSRGLPRRLREHTINARKIKHQRLHIWIRSVWAKGHRLVIFEIESGAVPHAAEMRLITWYRAHGANLVNGTDGGQGCWGLDRRGQKKPPDFGAKISVARKGIKLPPVSEATKAKISAFNRGKILTDEHKRKIAAAHEGKTASDAVRQHLSELKRGKRLPLTPEQEAARRQRAALSSGRPDVRAKRSATMKATLARKKMEKAIGVDA